MWFDARKALAEVEPDGPRAATPATIATNIRCRPPGVAEVAEVAGPRPVRSETAPELDAAALLGLLERDGPRTYGAAAVALGIGATRAVAAETALRRAGRIRLGPLGAAVPLAKEALP